jgi:16S rRNA (cytosine1402-N4)-methyltransferase
MAEDFAHHTVLLDEAVQALAVQPDGTYVDATFGRGGHSRRILQQLSANGRLLVIDRDLQALATAQALAAQDSRVRVASGAFENLDAMIQGAFAEEGRDKVDGILFDLGVSSPQLDDARRGFSFQQDGPLDMRMDNRQGQSAAEWLATADEDEMSQVFWRYGEEKNARRMARAIGEYRSQQPLTRTAQLAEIAASVNRKYQKKHPATRIFQAIRIHVNKELEQVEKVLPKAMQVLKPGGRLVVISFHSLEDRLVKRFFKEQSSTGKVDRRMPLAVNEKEPQLRLIGKAIKAGEHELAINPRSRSAVMRVAEKT